jgi:hypothetical protein
MKITVDYDKLKKAIQRNPQKTKDEVNIFLVRTQSVIKQGIVQEPWRVGATSGGVPVKTGNLKKAHEYTIEPFRFVVAVNKRKTQVGKWNYASLVHDGTSKMEARPWLTNIEKTKRPQIDRLAKDMLEKITTDLGK